VGITSDGAALWFVEIAAGRIDRISLDGEIREFPLPDRTAKPHAIVAASTGKCWFTEWGANRMGHITDGGEFAEYSLPSRRPSRTASPRVLTALCGWPLEREGSRG
jgi:virginiamycin B lyase